MKCFGPKNYKKIIEAIVVAEEKETSGLFVDTIMNVILKGVLTDSLIDSMNRAFSGRYVDEDKMAAHHEKMKKCGVILAEYGTIRSCYLAIQLANMLGRKVYPVETIEKLTHAVLEDAPKSDEDRWISRIVQSYFIID
jgi:hypothetical protein